MKNDWDEIDEWVKTYGRDRSQDTAVAERPEPTASAPSAGIWDRGVEEQSYQDHLARREELRNTVAPAQERMGLWETVKRNPRQAGLSLEPPEGGSWAEPERTPRERLEARLERPAVSQAVSSMVSPFGRWEAEARFARAKQLSGDEGLVAVHNMSDKAVANELAGGPWYWRDFSGGFDRVRPPKAFIDEMSGKLPREWSESKRKLWINSNWMTETERMNAQEIEARPPTFAARTVANVVDTIPYWESMAVPGAVGKKVAAGIARPIIGKIAGLAAGAQVYTAASAPSEYATQRAEGLSPWEAGKKAVVRRELEYGTEMGMFEGVTHGLGKAAAWAGRGVARGADVATYGAARAAASLAAKGYELLSGAVRDVAGRLSGVKGAIGDLIGWHGLGPETMEEVYGPVQEAVLNLNNEYQKAGPQNLPDATTQIIKNLPDTVASLAMQSALFGVAGHVQSRPMRKTVGASLGQLRAGGYDVPDDAGLRKMKFDDRIELLNRTRDIRAMDVLGPDGFGLHQESRDAILKMDPQDRANRVREMKGAWYQQQFQELGMTPDEAGDVVAPLHRAQTAERRWDVEHRLGMVLVDRRTDERLKAWGVDPAGMKPKEKRAALEDVFNRALDKRLEATVPAEQLAAMSPTEKVNAFAGTLRGPETGEGEIKPSGTAGIEIGARGPAQPTEAAIEPVVARELTGPEAGARQTLEELGGLRRDKTGWYHDQLVALGMTAPEAETAVAPLRRAETNREILRAESALDGIVRDRRVKQGSTGNIEATPGVAPSPLQEGAVVDVEAAVAAPPGGLAAADSEVLRNIPARQELHQGELGRGTAQSLANLERDGLVTRQGRFVALTDQGRTVQSQEFEREAVAEREAIQGEPPARPVTETTRREGLEDLERRGLVTRMPTMTEPTAQAVTETPPQAVPETPTPVAVSKPQEEKGHYWRDGDKFSKVKSEVVPVAVEGFEGHDLFAHETTADAMPWRVTEGVSGLAVGRGETREAAVADAETRLTEQGPEGLTRTIGESVANQGRPSPRHAGYHVPFHAGQRVRHRATGRGGVVVSRGKAGLRVTTNGRYEDIFGWAPVEKAPKTQKGGTINAVEKGKKPEGGVGEHPGIDVERPVAEAGGGNRVGQGGVVAGQEKGQEVGQKQPWEMTQPEFDEAARQRAEAIHGSGKTGMPSYGNIGRGVGRHIEAARRQRYTKEGKRKREYQVDERSDWEVAREMAVREAASEGKSVPAEVLAEYPDLAPKIVETVPSTTTEARVTESAKPEVAAVPPATTPSVRGTIEAVMVAAFGTRAKYLVYRRFEDLPATLRAVVATRAKVLGGGKLSQIRLYGFYHGGRVYFMEQGLEQGASDAGMTLEAFVLSRAMHEYGVHFGLRHMMAKLYGPHAKAAMDDLLRSIYASVGREKILAALPDTYAKGSPLDLAEEYLAHIAQKLDSAELSEQDRGLWARFVEVIRNAVSGLKVRFTDADVERIARYAVASARAEARRKTATEAAGFTKQGAPMMREAAPKAEKVVTVDEGLMEFRQRVRDKGIKPLSGKGFTAEDFGWKIPMQYMRKGSRMSWDQWAQEAEQMGLLKAGYGPDDFGKLFEGPVKKTVTKDVEGEMEARARREVQGATRGADATPVNATELEEGDLVAKGGEWLKVVEKTAGGGAVLKDGEEVRLDDFETTDAAMVVKQDDPAHGMAEEEYQRQQEAAPATDFRLLFHGSPHAEEILQHGFRVGGGQYHVPWVSATADRVIAESYGKTVAIDPRNLTVMPESRAMNGPDNPAAFAAWVRGQGFDSFEHPQERGEIGIVNWRKAIIREAPMMSDARSQQMEPRVFVSAEALNRLAEEEYQRQQEAAPATEQKDLLGEAVEAPAAQPIPSSGQEDVFAGEPRSVVHKDHPGQTTMFSIGKAGEEEHPVAERDQEKSQKKYIEVLFPDTMPNEPRDVIRGWPVVSKSPYSDSFYDITNKSWGLDPEGFLRVADHWNFESQGDIHARTDRDPAPNSWTLARHENGIYRILAEWPEDIENAPARRTAREQRDFDRVYSHRSRVMRELLDSLLRHPRAASEVMGRHDATKRSYMQVLLKSGIANEAKSGEILANDRYHGVPGLVEYAKEHPRAQRVYYVKPEHVAHVAQTLGILPDGGARDHDQVEEETDIRFSMQEKIEKAVKAVQNYAEEHILEKLGGEKGLGRAARWHLHSDDKNARADYSALMVVLGVTMRRMKRFWATRRVWDAMMDQRTNRHVLTEQAYGAIDANGDETGHSDVDVMTTAQKKKKAEYVGRASVYIRETRDMEAVGYRVEQDKKGNWALLRPDGGVEADVADEAAGWAAAIQAEMDEMTAGRIWVRNHKGGIVLKQVEPFSPEIVALVGAYRRISHRNYNHLLEQGNAAERELKEAGVPPPMVNYEGKEISVFEAWRRMGDRRGYYMPRIRPIGRYLLLATKEEKDSQTGETKVLAQPIREHFLTPMFRFKRAVQLSAQGYEVDKKRSEAPTEDVFSATGVVALNDALQQALKKVERQNKELTPRDLTGLGFETGSYKRTNQDGQEETHFWIRDRKGFSEGWNELWKSLGGERYIDEQGPKDEVWHFIGDPKGIQQVLTKAAGQYAIRANVTARAFGEALAGQIAVMVQSRGSRARKIGRDEAVGIDVWAGYEKDPIKALVLATTSIAGGTAKAEMARTMVNAMMGIETPWREYAQQNQGPDWDTLSREQRVARRLELYARWDAEVQERRLESGRQPLAFKDTLSFISEALRNEETMERIFGTIKGLTSLKLISGVKSGVVNLTTLVINVPSVFHQEGKIPILTTYKLLKDMGEKYVLWQVEQRTGKPLARVTDADRRLFTEIRRKGWDEPLMNMEAMSVLQSEAGKQFRRVMDLGMIVFSSTEQFNRGVTVAMGFRGLGGEAAGDDAARADILRRAKEMSDHAHASYGKNAIPALMRGSGMLAQTARMAYMYSTFVHNQVHMMFEMGFSRDKRDLKALAYLMTSLPVLGGIPALGGLGIKWTVEKAAQIAFAALGMVPPDDPEEAFYDWLAETFGWGAERFARGGLAGLAGVDISGSLRAGAGDLPLSPRDFVANPQKAQDDLALYIGKTLLGPVMGGFAVEEIKGAGEILSGTATLNLRKILRGAERMAPAPISGPMQARREYSEGVTTRAGAPVFYGSGQIHASLIASIIRSLSFNPIEISAKRKKQWSEAEIKRQYGAEKNAFYERVDRCMRGSQAPAEWYEILLERERFNARIVAHGYQRFIPLITETSMKAHLRAEFKAPKAERER